jgi:hypothetical protein
MVFQAIAEGLHHQNPLLSSGFEFAGAEEIRRVIY